MEHTTRRFRLPSLLQHRLSSMRRFQDDCFCRLWLAPASRSSTVTDVCVQRRAVTSSTCACACTSFGLIGRAPIHTATQGGSHTRVSAPAGVDFGVKLDRSRARRQERQQSLTTAGGLCCAICTACRRPPPPPTTATLPLASAKV